MRPVNNFTEIKKTSKNLKENKVKQKFIRLKSSCVKRYSLFFDWAMFLFYWVHSQPGIHSSWGI